MKKRRTLWKREDGTTAIEFALIAPILLLLMMGIMEFGLILFANNVIENAVTIGARYGITGSDYAGENRVSKPLTGPQDRLAVIKENIKVRSGGLLDEDKISISCQPLGKTFGALTDNQTGSYSCGSGIDNDQSCSNIGAGDEAVVYTVSYCWPLFTPLIGQFFDQNQALLQSSLVVKNEDFDPAQQ